MQLPQQGAADSPSSSWKLIPAARCGGEYRCSGGALALEVDVDAVKLGLGPFAVVVQIAENFPIVLCHQKLRVFCFPAASDAVG
jgi:hypothetical protein